GAPRHGHHANAAATRIAAAAVSRTETFTWGDGPGLWASVGQDRCSGLAGAAREKFREQLARGLESGTVVGTERLAGIELHRARIARHTVHAEFVVQVGRGGRARAADLADLVALHHGTPGAERARDPAQVRVAGGDPVAVAQFHHVAVAAGPSRPDDDAVGGGP